MALVMGPLLGMIRFADQMRRMSYENEERMERMRKKKNEFGKNTQE